MTSPRTIIISLIFISTMSPITLARSPTQLCRDVATKIETTYYKYGYGSKVRSYSTIPSLFCVQQLARTERDIYMEIIQSYQFEPNSSSINASSQVLDYVKDYEESALVLHPNFESEEYVHAVGGNLVSVYRMVRRFRHFIQPWMTSRQSHDELVNKLKMIYNVTKGPLRTDLHLAMLAFPLLQYKFEIKAEQIAVGNYSGRVTGLKMKAIHCLEIGLHSFVSGFYPIGIEWLEHGLKQVREGDNTVDKNLAKNYLKRAVAKHDANWQPFNELDQGRIFYTKPLNETGPLQRKWQRQQQQQLENSSTFDSDWLAQEYNRVCRGDITQEVKGGTLTYCWHETSIHPMWKIGPLKAELLTPLPDQVVQFHDVVRQNFIQQLKTATQTKFRTETRISTTVHDPKVVYSGSMRTLLQESPQVYAKLEKLTQRVTGLKFERDFNQYYDTFQLASYGPGGFSSLHWDSPKMLATFVIYLEEPQVGGGTGFPTLGFASTALKGSAIIWFNVNSAGEFAQRTAHGSCPVVFGYKWAAVRVIQYIEQDHLKCDKDQQAGLDYLTNGRPIIIK